MLPQQNINTEYDQSLYEDPAWVDVKQAAEMLARGDRQVRNIADRFSWPRKYAKKDGKPYVFYAKAAVDEYLKNKPSRSSETIIQPIAPAFHNEIAENVPDEDIASSTILPLAETPEKGIPAKNLPDSPSSNELTIAESNSLLRDMQLTQKEILDRLAKIEERKDGGEDTGYWKLKSETTQSFNMKLLIITLLLMLMAGGGGVLVFHRISALMEQNAKMSQDLHAKDAKISTFESILNKFQMPAQPKLEKTPEPIHQESTMPTPAQE